MQALHTGQVVQPTKALIIGAIHRGSRPPSTPVNGVYWRSIAVNLWRLELIQNRSSP